MQIKLTNLPKINSKINTLFARTIYWNNRVEYPAKINYNKCVKMLIMLGYDEKNILKITNRVDINTIIDYVIRHYAITYEQLIDHSKKATIVRPRQVAMALACDANIGHLSYIGNNIGGFDHATVIWAKKCVNNLVDTNKKFAEEYNTHKMFLGIK